MWHELTVREQEAASDMLGYDEASWDQEMLDDDDDDRAGNSSLSSSSSSLSTELDDERTDTYFGSYPITPEDGETVIYLDDSQSMIYRKVGIGDGGIDSFVHSPACLNAGKRILSGVLEQLEGQPTRLLKFGGWSDPVDPGAKEKVATLLRRRTFSVHGENRRGSRDALELWNGSSGSTFMWKMIEEDILDTYLPPAVTSQWSAHGWGGGASREEDAPCA